MLNNKSQQEREKFVLSVDSLVTETLNKIGEGYIASPEYVLALCETISCYVNESLQVDLPAFATHAKRRTITGEDVKLILRKTPALSKKFETFLEEINNSTTTTTPRLQKKKRISTTSTTTTQQSKKGKQQQEPQPPRQDTGTQEDESEEEDDDDDDDVDNENNEEDDLFQD